MYIRRYLTVDKEGIVYDWSNFMSAYNYCIKLSNDDMFSTFIDTEQKFMICHIDVLIAHKENIQP